MSDTSQEKLVVLSNQAREDTIEILLPMLEQLSVLVDHVNELCLEYGFSPGYVPLRLSYLVLVSDEDVPRCYRLRVRTDAKRLWIYKRYTGYASTSQLLPLTGIEAERFVRSLSNQSLQEFSEWVAALSAWLIDRHIDLSDRAFHQIEYAHQPGLLQRIMWWLAEIFCP